MALSIILLVIFISFLCEYVDSSLGMGYGTALAPVLLLLGFAPLQIVPVILLSELISGVMAGVLHHKEGNVDFKLKHTNLFTVIKKLKIAGLVRGYKKGVSFHLKIAAFLATLSIIGTITAVFVALNIPALWIRLYIGGLVFVMGLTILLFHNKKVQFSWTKVGILGTVASFNKGISGGGYGPVVTSGQILSGINSKSAIGITSLAEGITCFIGVLTYILISGKPTDWTLAPYVITGAVLSVPLSVKSVKIVSDNYLKAGVAILSLGLGLFTILNALKII